MIQIDLDDLPPRIAQALTTLSDGQALVIVQGGRVVARLTVEQPAPSPAPDTEPASEAVMKEVMEQFNAMIHDEF